MAFDNKFLFGIAAIVYLFNFIFFLLKRKYNFFQHISFFVLFANVTFLIDRWMFKLSLDSRPPADVRITLVPFYEIIKMLLPENAMLLQRIFSLMFYSAFVSLIIGITIPIVTKAKSYKTALIKAFSIILPIEIIGVICIYTGATIQKHFDTSILIVQFAGVSIGYLLYKVLIKNIFIKEGKNNG